MSAVLTYRRNHRGEVVHRSDCPRVGRTSVPWNFADGFTADQILSTIAQHRWLRPCRICRPDGAEVAA